MHAFSSLTIGIFVAGYITARWDLVAKVYDLAVFAWDRGVVVIAAPSSNWYSWLTDSAVPFDQRFRDPILHFPASCGST